MLIGKFIVEVPFVLKPVESEDVRNALKSARVSQGAAENVALTNAQVAHLNSKEKSPFAEPEENNMIFADIPINFVPVVPVYVVKPADDHAYSWPQLGTYGANQKLIWHPDKKLTKEQKSEQDRLKKEAQEAKKRQQAEEREVYLNINIIFPFYLFKYFRLKNKPKSKRSQTKNCSLLLESLKPTQ